MILQVIIRDPGTLPAQNLGQIPQEENPHVAEKGSFNAGGDGGETFRGPGFWCIFL